jgi:hypothetical protein
MTPRTPSPFPLPKRARVKKYRIGYADRFCALSDSLALWERVRACPGLDPGVRAALFSVGESTYSVRAP